MVIPRPSLPQVLVSDETPHLLAQVETILSEAGYAVSAAPALPAALAFVEEQLFHFILTDAFAQPGLLPSWASRP